MLPPKYEFVRQIVATLWAGKPDSVTLVRESANVVFRFEVKGIRPLSDLTVASLPWFMRFKTLSGYAWELGDNDKPYDHPDMVTCRKLFAHPLAW